MSGKKRGLRTALGACAVMAASCGLAGVGASPASADYQQSDPNPLSTNVPYLAWRGEHVRLVKCESDLPGSDMEVLKSSANSEGRLNIKLHVNTDVLVEDWSGLADFKPQVASGTVDLFFSPYKGLCVKADVISQKAGLAMIKMMATLDPGNDSGLVDIITRSEILAAHQFLVGWMNLGTPTLTELPVGGDGPLGTNNLNNFNASNDPSKDGVLRATLNGNLPLGNNFSELGLGDTLTLPDGWPALANALASDRNVDNAPHVGTQYRWDIHDSTTDEEGHPLQSYACRDHVPFNLDPVGPFGDAVDNCLGGLSFSRVFDASGQSGNLGKFALPNTTGYTIGPFDPQRADETFLGDGRLTPDDAPMPSARLDVSIAAGGIGSLYNNDKQTFFSRDRVPGANAGSGDPSKKHNLYAPFYDAYIPATADGSFLLFGSPVSGTDGPSTGNNFPGYLADSPYHFWDIAHVLTTAYAQQTHCLNRLVNGYPQYRLTPAGPQSVVIYTDEHGMAQVNYRAGTGANYDALGDRDNANGGCDLKGVDVLGRANVSAEARYPYQPTTDIAPRVSPVVTKVVHSLFSKELTVWPKGSSADLRNTRIVVAHAQDVDGSPYANEKVCFLKSTAEGQIRPYVYNGVNARFVGGYDLAGASSTGAPLDSTVCMITNAAGNAAIEVTQSTGQVVDLTGDFTDEGLLREKHINFAQPIPSDQQQPVGPGPIGDDSTPPAAGPVPNPVVPLPGNSAPVSTDGQQAAAALAAALGTKAPAKVNAKLATVRYAHLVSAKGSRYLVIRLDGKATAKVRIKLFNKKGKAITMVERKISAGKSVKISGLKFTKDVQRVSVKVIG